MASSIPLHHLLPFLLLFFFIYCDPSVALSSPAVLNKRRPKWSKSMFLPLKTQQVPSVSLPRPPQAAAGNKLYFHHNVSLTVSLSVGFPPQNVTMVLDTGSELSWLLCSATNAAAATSSFHPKSSSTYVSIPCSSPTCKNQTRDLPSPAFCDGPTGLCHVSLSYADASTSDGNLAVDVLRIGQSPPMRTLFGCMTSSFSSSASDPVTTGLLGMNRGALSLVSQMGTRRFSYCISDHDSSGVLLLGDQVLPFSLSLNYTPMIQIALPLPYFDRVAYSVELQGIRVANNILPIPKSVLVPDHTGAGQTMMDSGTQFTFLLGPAYTVLKNEFIRQTRGILTVLNEPNFAFQEAFDLCYRIPLGKSPPTALPSVTMIFRGAEMMVAGDRLLYRVAGEQRGGDGIWCLTFGNSDLVPLEAYIIGHHQQQNVWVEYDLENGRVGFAPIQCDVAGQRLMGNL